MNYFSTLAAYVAQFDEEKKAALDLAKRDLKTIAEALEGSDIVADIFQTAFMMTQYASYSEALTGHFEAFLKDSITCTVSVDDYLSYSQEYMDEDGKDSYIDTLTPAEAFNVGRFSNFGIFCHYFRLDGYGHFQGVTDSQIEEAAENDREYIEEKAEEIKDQCEDYEATASMVAELATVLVQAGY